jgi:hypothetical protein
VYDLTRIERVVLVAVGADGLPFRAVRELVGSDRTPLDRLFDGGYLWVSDPDDGPFYCLSELGLEAIGGGVAA